MSYRSERAIYAAAYATAHPEVPLSEVPVGARVSMTVTGYVARSNGLSWVVKLDGGEELRCGPVFPVTVITPTVTEESQPVAATEIGTSTTLDFPNPVARRLGEVAIDRERERQERHRDIERTLNLFHGEHLGRLIEIDYDTQVVEIASKAASMFGVVHMGSRDFYRFHTVDEALLRAVEIRNDGAGNGQGHAYAARMLGAGAKPTEEPKP